MHDRLKAFVNTNNRWELGKRTHFEIIKLEDKVEDFCKLFEESLLGLQVLLGSHIVGAEGTKQLLHHEFWR